MKILSALLELGNAAFSASGLTAPRNITFQDKNIIVAGLDDISAIGGTLPVASPAINLNFANGRYIDPRFTFSRSSIATYVDNLLKIKTAQANEPRFNYNVLTGYCSGLTIEPSSVNNCLYSDDFSNAAWVKSNITVTANAETAPDGTLTMDRLDDSNTVSTALVTQTLAAYATASVVYCSIFLKQGTAAKTDVNCYATGDSEANAKVTWGSTPTTTLGTLTAYPNNCYLLQFTVTTTATGAFLFRVWATDRASVTNTGDVYVWGARASLTPLNVPYTQTTSADVTTSQDLLSCSGSAFNFYRQEAYSVYVIFRLTSLSTNTIFDFSDGTANERVYLQVISGVLYFKIDQGGSNQTTLNLGAVSVNTEYRVAASWTLNDMAASINGAACVVYAFSPMPLITRLSIGADYLNANSMNGRVVLFRGYPLALTDSELQALTL